MAARPSTYILRKAWLLGQKMAKKERRLRPDLRDVALHSTFSFFKKVHRYYTERKPGFQYWDEKLRKLIEREGNGRGVAIDDPRVWEAFYTYYGEPIRDVFWAAWEDAFMLKTMYERESARIAQAQAHRAPVAPIHVANALDPVKGEPELWDHIAEKVLDELGGDADDKRWQVPADAQGATGALPSENTKAAG